MQTPPNHRGNTDEAVKRLARVLRLLHLIQSQPQEWTRERLAGHFGMSSRQIDKDLQLLRAVGYEIKRAKGGYAITAEPVYP